MDDNFLNNIESRMKQIENISENMDILQKILDSDEFIRANDVISKLPIYLNKINTIKKELKILNNRIK